MNTDLKQELKLQRLLPNLTAGLVTGILVVIIELSFAVLIFSGPLANHVASGIGLTLFGAVVIGLVVALTSSFSGTQAAPQDSPAAILALIAAAIAKNMSASASPDAIFFTVVAAIAITSLLAGVFFLLLGHFKLGSLVRFIPYPVVGGFLAGTGWLLVLGAMGVMTGTSLTLSGLGVLFQIDMLIKWLPGALFAVLLLVIMRRLSHFLIMPAMLFGAVGLFYGALGLTHMSVAEASAQGWLLGPFPQGSLWQPLTPAALAQVDWVVILGQMDKIGTILIIAVISLLLNSSGIELAVRQDLDLDRELESAGMANLLAGLGGGPAGYQLLGISVLGQKMGARGRLINFIAVAFCALVLFLGTSLLSLFPKPVLGGLLFFLGLAFLSEWVYDAWFKLSHTDYALILIILAIVAAIGFLEGVAAGIGIAIVLFVINYSRINLVRHTLSGANFHSAVDRPPSQRQFLREHGEQLWVLQLQGFIFFGTAQSLLDQIRRRVANSQLPHLQFIVFDFARVNGLDSSAVSSFIKMKQFAESKNIQLVLAHLTAEMQRQLERGGLGDERVQVLHIFPTLDQGVEWCEDQILANDHASVNQTRDDLQAQLAHAFPIPADFVRLLSYFEKDQVGAGTILVRQGEPSDELFFIEAGQATAQFNLPDGRMIRLRTMRRGTIIGEVGLYMGNVRTASVQTTEPTTLYRLSARAIQRMEAQDPQVAAALHKWIARLMAERLAENNNTMEAMLD